jgi:hypothetical protein
MLSCRLRELKGREAAGEVVCVEVSVVVEFVC